MEGTIIRCPACGQSNRIPARTEGKSVRCGKCKNELNASAGAGAPVVLTDASFATRSDAERAMVVDFGIGAARRITGCVDC